MRRSLLGLSAILATMTGLAPVSYAQTPTAGWPAKPIVLVVPQAPGGGTDVLGRLWADYVSKALPATVIVENKPGANGILASSHVAKQPADGYTLLLGGISFLTFNPITYKSLPYNPDRDFDGVALLTNTPFLLVASNDSGIKSLADLIQKAKTAPNSLTFASGGKGNSTHLVTELLLQREAGAKITHVPYNGGAPALTSVIGNHTQFMSDVLNTAAVQVKAGRVQPLAVIGSKRATSVPDVPTLAELGVKDFPLPGWYAMVAPAGTPKAVLERLNAVTQTFFTDPQVKERLATLQYEPLPSKPETVKEWMRKDTKIWGPLIRELGISND